MASKGSTGKNTSGQNQPPLREVKYSLSNKTLEFLNLRPSRWYSPHIPSQSTPDLTYTSSPETLNRNLNPSLKEELHGVTPEETVYWIPNNEVDQLHWHTHAYLQSIGQIPIVYQIPRSCTPHRSIQPYGENKTLASSIDDLIIDIISEIIQPIVSISHSKSKEDLEFQNILDFPEVDSIFYNFPKAKEGGSRPLKPPETNPSCTNPLSPQPNFNFLANMEANREWLVVDTIVVPSAQHPLPKHLENLLP